MGGAGDPGDAERDEEGPEHPPAVEVDPRPPRDRVGQAEDREGGAEHQRDRVEVMTMHGGSPPVGCGCSRRRPRRRGAACRLRRPGTHDVDVGRTALVRRRPNAVTLPAPAWPSTTTTHVGGHGHVELADAELRVHATPRHREVDVAEVDREIADRELVAALHARDRRVVGASGCRSRRRAARRPPRTRRPRARAGCRARSGRAHVRTTRSTSSAAPTTASAERDDDADVDVRSHPTPRAATRLRPGRAASSR